MIMNTTELTTLTTRGGLRPQRRASLPKLAALALAVVAFAGGQQQAQADARAQARRMHDRLVGTPPSQQTLDEMEAAIAAGNPMQAALDAISPTARDSAPFYNVTLKNFATPWTNRDMSVFAPLNDYTATVIGMVRDDVPFNQLLSADILYVGSGSGVPAYSPASNENYVALESTNADLRTNAVLMRTTQSALTGIPATATAGVMTTRGGSEAFFIDGTNRAMFRFTLLNHLCRDLEQVHDTSRAPDRIRQDVTRSPGGDSRVFLNNCVGCHSGMDPLAQAFAYYDFDETQGRLVYTPGQVQPKYLINSDNFKPGFITPDDHWENRWREGQNRGLGWSSALSGSGTGAKSMGEELANSEAFAQCQVEKVFRTVCYRAPSNTADRTAVTGMVNNFKNGYRLKNVFAESAVYCRGN